MVEQLASGKPGDAGVLIRLKSAVHGIERLMEMGLVPGTHVALLRLGFRADPLLVRVRQTIICLSRAQAESIEWIRAPS